jgi:uncharacterized membrane protein YhaH (DUF805 family)
MQVSPARAAALVPETCWTAGEATAKQLPPETSKPEASRMTMIDPLTATAVLAATAATDAVYVMFTSAVVARKRLPAATWSSIWYLLSSYAVISYTENWVYVAFAAAGSWIGAFVSITFLHRPPGGPPIGAGPE